MNKHHFKSLIYAYLKSCFHNKFKYINIKDFAFHNTLLIKYQLIFISEYIKVVL